MCSGQKLRFAPGPECSQPNTHHLSPMCPFPAISLHERHENEAHGAGGRYPAQANGPGSTECLGTFADLPACLGSAHSLLGRSRPVEARMSVSCSWPRLPEKCVCACVRALSGLRVLQLISIWVRTVQPSAHRYLERISLNNPLQQPAAIN